MEIKNGILFILGSGASVDSGLFTYRGNNSINGSIVSVNDSYEMNWKKSEWIIERISEIKNNPQGDTYAVIQQIIDKVGHNVKSTILTQNIDGLIHDVKGAKIVELHGTIRESICDKCGNIESMKLIDDSKECSECCHNLRPNIIRMGDDLKVDYRSFSKRKKYDIVIIVGTTLQFPYLRWIIGQAKGYGAKVIHINPDETYNDTYAEPVWSYFDLKKYKKVNRVRKDEKWICANSADGLRTILETITSK